MRMNSRNKSVENYLPEVSKVWVRKKFDHEGDFEATLALLRDFKPDRLFQGKKKILINPNWVHNEHYRSGNTTSTETLAAIVEYLIDQCEIDPKNLMVGDGGFGSIDPTIDTVGAIKLEKKYGVNVLNLDEGPYITKRIPDPLSLKKCKINHVFEECDSIISVPSLKTHIWAVTTLSMKNLMGFLSRKSIMHSSIHQKIADLTSLFRHKMTFSLIDGYIGSDMSETGGNPVKMDVALVSEDPVALDTIGSWIIGYDKKDCQYLRYGQQKQLGWCDRTKINVLGDSPKKVAKKFKR